MFCVATRCRFSHLRCPVYSPNWISSVSIWPYSVSNLKALTSLLLTPISLRHSSNSPTQSPKVPILKVEAIVPLDINDAPARSPDDSILQAHPNTLQFGVVLDGVHAQFAPKARLLIAAKWHRRIHQAVSIDPHNAGAQLRCPLDQFFHESIVRPRFHKQTRAGIATLAFAVEDSGDGALHRAIQIGISKHDVGRFTAQLQRHSLQIVGGSTHDFFAHRGRAGESDLVYAFMFYQRLPGLRTAGNDIQHARGQPRLLRQFAETQRRERSLLRGLQYESAAAGQRRPQFPGGQQQRKIPRYDSGHHADG